jgi:hypothetical protein
MPCQQYSRTHMPTNTIDSNHILDRLKEVYGLERDTKVAQFLDLTPSAVSAWRRRNTIDLNLVIARCLSTLNQKLRLVNIHWLVTGAGESTFETPTSMITDELLSTRSPEESEQIAKRVVEKLRAQGVDLPDDAWKRAIPSPKESQGSPSEEKHTRQRKQK